MLEQEKLNLEKATESSEEPFVKRDCAEGAQPGDAEPQKIHQCREREESFDSTTATGSDSDKPNKADLELAPSVKTRVGSSWRTGETIIIIDWDDTLLCTTFLAEFDSSLEGPLSPDLQKRLKCIETAVVNLLDTACSLSKTWIVTNAAQGWVQTSAARYLPGLVPTLEKVPIISAREAFELRHPGDACAWKRLAFQDVQRRHGRQSGANVVALGDSVAEMDAARACAARVPGSRTAVKAVRFWERPSPEELHYQLLLAVRALESIVSSTKSLTVRFSRSNIPKKMPQTFEESGLVVSRGRRAKVRAKAKRALKGLIRFVAYPAYRRSSTHQESGSDSEGT